MRRALSCSLAFYCMWPIVAAVQCQAEQQFPYTAYINDESAIIRSGPGTEYYATESLPWATRVEVYRHKGDTWAAIRPSSQSFSWILADSVERSDRSDLGVVNQTATVMIGSGLNDRTEAECITLEPGEAVDILGEAEIDVSGIGRKRCLKISPPAGEFRWMRIRQLTSKPPERHSDEMAPYAESIQQVDHEEPIRDDSEDESASSHWLVPPMPAAGERLAMADDTPATSGVADFDPETAHLDRVPPPKDGDKLLALPRLPSHDDDLHEDRSGPDPAREPAPLNRGRSGDAGRQLNRPPSASTERLTATPGREPWTNTPTDPNYGLPPEDELVPFIPNDQGRSRPVALGPVGRLKMSQEMGQIELELTEQIALPPDAWQLEDLRVRAQAVIDTSDKAEQRTAAHQVLAKVAQMRDLQRRQFEWVDEQERISLRTSTSTRFAMRSETGPNAGSASRVASRAGDRSTGSSYDGEGWLMPVVTDDPGFPRYVLTDEQGNIKQFVSPKPGMNLRNYEQKRIAIYGQRGLLPTYDQPHLMAERIISLDKVR